MLLLALSYLPYIGFSRRGRGSIRCLPQTLSLLLRILEEVCRSRKEVQQVTKDARGKDLSPSGTDD